MLGKFWRWLRGPRVFAIARPRPDRAVHQGIVEEANDRVRMQVVSEAWARFQADPSITVIVTKVEDDGQLTTVEHREAN